MTLLEPGIYPGIPGEHYHSLPYCSNSRLSLLKRSPAHLKADLDNPPAATDAMRLGTAIHAAVLEPEVFAATYTEAGTCEALLKSGERKGEPCGVGSKGRWGGQWLCGKHPGEGEPDAVQVLTRAEFLTCHGVRDSLRSHPRLGKVLEAEGMAELTVIWDDPDTGVRCKARIDWLTEAFGGVVMDLKTTQDARPSAFERKVFEFGMFRQQPMYQDALRICGIPTQHMVIAAAEKGAPYAVAGYRLTEDAADAGREEVRRLLRVYAECQERGEWPAYPTQITDISLPSWSWNELEEAA